MVSVCSCGGKNGSGDFPDNFGTIGDAGRVSYMMKNVTPDSVARFICDAALGKVEGARIDSLPTATLYAYEHYKNTDRHRLRLNMMLTVSRCLWKRR